MEQQPVSTQPVQSPPPVVPPQNPNVNAQANRKSLFLIIGIIVLVIIFVGMILIAMISPTSPQLAPSMTKQLTPTPLLPSPTVTNTSSSSEEEIDTLDTGDPTQDLTILDQQAAGL